MKKLLFACALCYALSLSCKKADEPVQPAVDDTPVAISNIQLHVYEMTIGLGWSDGVVLQIDALTPEEADFSMLRSKVEDESIISVSPHAYGFLIKPKALGETYVTIIPKDGPGIATCKVTVIETALANAVEITSISADPASVELTDEGSTGGALHGDRIDVKITLDPSTANLTKDVDVYTDRMDDCGEMLRVEAYSKGTLRIEAPLNEDDKTYVAGDYHVYVRPKRGSAPTLDIPVKVYGHIFGAEFKGAKDDAKEVAVIDGEKTLNLTAGSDFDLKPTLLTTGPLKEDAALHLKLADKIDNNGYYVLTSEGEQYASVSDAGVISPKKGAGLGKKFYVVAYGKDEKSVLKVLPLYIYDPVSSLELVDVTPKTDGNLFVGEYNTFEATISPATARQTVEWEYDGKHWELYQQPNARRITLKVIKGTVSNQALVKVTHVDGKVARLNYVLDGYAPDEVKPGDYIWYNTSTQSFRWQDGGLRASQTDGDRPDVFRFAENLPEAKPQQYEYPVGVVFEVLTTTDAAGFKTASGITLATVGSGSKKKAVCCIGPVNCENAQFIPANDTYADISDAWKNHLGKSYGDIPVSSASTPQRAWEIQKGWEAYNKYCSGNHQMKIQLTVAEYGQKYPAPSAAGSSGWMVFSYNYGKIYDLKNILNTSLKRMEGAKELSTTYWTPLVSTTDKRGVLYSLDEHRGKDNLLSNHDNVRPMVIL